MVFVTVCVKGANQENHLKVCQKSPFYQQLNAIEEQNMFADERIGHEAQYFALYDLYPPDANTFARLQQTKQKRSILSKKQEVFELISALYADNDLDYNEQCWEQPIKLTEGTCITEIIQTLESAFGQVVPKSQFWVEPDQSQLFLFGIPNKYKAYTDADRSYSVFYLSRKVNCEAVIKQLAEQQVNIYLVMPGIWEQTLRQAEFANKQLHNCIVVYDTQNLYRVLDDIFGTSGDHILLFDEEQYQVASEFSVGKLGDIIQEHEHQRQQMLQEAAQSNSGDEDGDVERVLSPTELPDGN